MWVNSQNDDNNVKSPYVTSQKLYMINLVGGLDKKVIIFYGVICGRSKNYFVFNCERTLNMASGCFIFTINSTHNNCSSTTCIKYSLNTVFEKQKSFANQKQS